MKKLFLLALLPLILSCRKAVPVPERWVQTFGGSEDDQGAAVALCPDGGYVVVGTTSSFGAGESDIYLVKADAKGKMVWTRTFGDTDYDYGKSVQTAVDSGFIVAGCVGDSVCLIKTNATGSQVWMKTFGDAVMDGGMSVLQARDCGYVLLYQTYIGEVEYTCLVKTDASGVSSWSEYLPINGEAVLQTSDGGYVVVGEVDEPDAECYDVGLVMVDASGHAVRANAYRRLESEDYGYSVQPTPDGGYIIAGEAEGPLLQVYIIRTDADGNEIWTSTLGRENEVSGHSIERTDDGGYVVAGCAEDDVLLLKLDADGDSLWTATYGGTVDDSRYSVRQTSDGGYVIAGTTDSNGLGDDDVLLLKTDSDGNVWP